MAIDGSCETELSLRLGGGHHPSSSTPAASDSESRSNILQAQKPQAQQQQQKKITIFYNGQISSCDVTEIQARAIINMAKQEAEERNDKENNQESLPLRMPQPPAVPRLLYPGLSTKLSLQRFLEKRKMRIGTASPYTATSHTRCIPLRYPRV